MEKSLTANLENLDSPFEQFNCILLNIILFSKMSPQSLNIKTVLGFPIWILINYIFES